MRYLSVCSGIEAASVAWQPLGWTPVAFSEIEAFPSAVLKHHYPSVPNWGDLTRFQEWPDAALDLLVGGTPCQSFSVAGLRKGLADPRGNLALTYLAVADKYRPRWLVWENVPGVLSADDGGALGAFLGGLSELGYGWAYRSLDAQYFRLAQRRRRVFVVGHLRDWRRAAAVLFERESLSGHPAPRRETGERPTGTLASRTSAGGGLGTDFDCDGGVITSHDPACTLTARDYKGPLPEADLSTVVALRGHSDYGDGLPSLRADGGDCAGGSEALIAHALRADGFDASEDGTGRGTPLVPIACDLAETLTVGANQTVGRPCGEIVVFAENQRGEVVTSDTMGSLKVGGGKPGQGYPAVASSMQVRRLTPRECARLQGFPDDYLDILYRGKPAKDGPKYKALGNSMAIPVVRWIGERIALVEDVIAELGEEVA